MPLLQKLKKYRWRGYKIFYTKIFQESQFEIVKSMIDSEFNFLTQHGCHRKQIWSEAKIPTITWKFQDNTSPTTNQKEF